MPWAPRGPRWPRSDRTALAVSLAAGTEWFFWRQLRAWDAMGNSARGTWFFLVVGAVVGLALGILVSASTDVPFAPEVGLVLGALVGWLLRRVRN
jgi:hypothetical protein